MMWLADWYPKNSQGKGVGFFQIGGGIAGDFPICVVPRITSYNVCYTKLLRQPGTMIGKFFSAAAYIQEFFISIS